MQVKDAALLVMEEENYQEILRLREVGNDILMRHTGQDRDKINQDTERDNFMSAEEAKAYGLIDEVINRPKKAAAKKATKE